MIGHLGKAARLIVASGAVWLLTAGAAHTKRAIMVNSQLLPPQQMVIADRNVGFMLPNGHYWCEPASGHWVGLADRRSGACFPRNAATAEPGERRKTI